METKSVELFKVIELENGQRGSVGPLYSANLSSPNHVCVNQGGTSSGKTYSILQVLFTLLSQEESTATVVGQDIPNLKAGALKDALHIYEGSEVLKSLISSYNKTDRVFFFNNGSKLEFKSYKDAQDAHSGKREYLFINEANGISFDIYEQLALRTTKRIFIDYNPSSEFWAHNLIGQESTEFFYSDHRHNPFIGTENGKVNPVISARVRGKIETLKDKDIEFWKVYARGITGRITGLVFSNWTIGDIPITAKNICAGQDFGFTNDPTTLIDMWVGDGYLYLDEKIYQTGLTNPDINKRLIEVAHPKRLPIVADSADPKSIEELRRMGWAMEAAQKGPDSITHGINLLKQFNIVVTSRSTNLRKELNNYKWKVGKDGVPENIPVDAFNHAIDAARYGALNYLNTSRGTMRFTITR